MPEMMSPTEVVNSPTISASFVARIANLIVFRAVDVATLSKPSTSRISSLTRSPSSLKVGTKILITPVSRSN